MGEIDYQKFLEAADIVCLHCVELGKENCRNCPVRHTCKYLGEITRKMLDTTDGESNE